MDIQKVRGGINWITNGSVRKVLSDLCDELEKFEKAFLRLENEFVLSNLPDPETHIPLKKIAKVVKEDAEKKRSPKQKKSTASKKT